MEIAFALFANAADVTPDGRLFIMGGGVDTIVAERFPFTQPAIALAVKLIVAPDECERDYQFEAQFVTPAGEAMGPAASLPIALANQPRNSPRAISIGLVIGFQGVEFPGPGVYRARLAVDGQPLGELPLELVEVPGANA